MDINVFFHILKEWFQRFTLNDLVFEFFYAANNKIIIQDTKSNNWLKGRNKGYLKEFSSIRSNKDKNYDSEDFSNDGLMKFLKDNSQKNWQTLQETFITNEFKKLSNKYQIDFVIDCDTNSRDKFFQSIIDQFKEIIKYPYERKTVECNNIKKLTSFDDNVEKEILQVSHQNNIEISDTNIAEEKYITDYKNQLIITLNKLNDSKLDENEKYNLIFEGIGITQKIYYEFNDFYNDQIMLDFKNYLIKDLNNNLNFRNDNEYSYILKDLFFNIDIFSYYVDFINLKKDNKFNIYTFIYYMCCIMYLYKYDNPNFSNYKFLFYSLREWDDVKLQKYIGTSNYLRTWSDIDFENFIFIDELTNFNNYMNRDIFIYLKKCPDTKYNDFVSFITFLHESDKSILDFYTNFCTQLHESGDL